MSASENFIYEPFQTLEEQEKEEKKIKDEIEKNLQNGNVEMGTEKDLEEIENNNETNQVLKDRLYMKLVELQS